MLTGASMARAGSGGTLGAPARKPATLDETLNASLAGLGLQPFARP